MALIAGALGFFFLGLRDRDRRRHAGDADPLGDARSPRSRSSSAAGSSSTSCSSTADRAPGRRLRVSRQASAPRRSARPDASSAPIFLLIALVLPFLLLAFAGRTRAPLYRPRHPHPHLRHARMGPEHRRRPRRPARPRLRRLLRGRRLFLRAARHSISASASGSACRSPASWRPSGASCSAFRCCACAATTSPS